jgi:hypothetical protein
MVSGARRGDGRLCCTKVALVDSAGDRLARSAACVDGWNGSVDEEDAEDEEVDEATMDDLGGAEIVAGASGTRADAGAALEASGAGVKTVPNSRRAGADTLVTGTAAMDVVIVIVVVVVGRE